MTRADYFDTIEGFEMRMDLMMRSGVSDWSLDTYMVLLNARHAVFMAMVDAT